MTSRPPRAVWASVDGADCIRIGEARGSESLVVRPAGSPAGSAAAGSLVVDGADLCFVPRYPFVDGASYEVVVPGADTILLVRSLPDRPATTSVVSIHPSATRVPRNLLRLYVTFSAPMGEGQARDRIRLVDSNGVDLVGALLDTDYELWSADRQRLTLLLDPGRIKQGLPDHAEQGYPLQEARPFAVHVDDAFVDATGAPLTEAARRDYEVGPVEGTRLDSGLWALGLPEIGTRHPLTLTFDRPLDHGLLARCLRVVDESGSRVPGSIGIAPGETSWSFRPSSAWRTQYGRILIDPVLEDTAGNSVSRVFDRDLQLDDPAFGSAPAALPFSLPLPSPSP